MSLEYSAKKKIIVSFFCCFSEATCKYCAKQIANCNCEFSLRDRAAPRRLAILCNQTVLIEGSLEQCQQYLEIYTCSTSKLIFYISMFFKILIVTYFYNKNQLLPTAVKNSGNPKHFTNKVPSLIAATMRP